MGVHAAQLTGRDCGPSEKQLNFPSEVLLLRGEVKASAVISLTWLWLGEGGSRAATLLLTIGSARSNARIHSGVMFSSLIATHVDGSVRSCLVTIVSFMRCASHENTGSADCFTI